MECPRCNSKLPDNLKFCGFCGVDVETGNATTVDMLITHIRTSLDHLYRKQSEMTNRTIASIGLIGISSTSLVGSYPFSSPQSQALGVLGVLGLLGGIWLSYMFIRFYGELSTGMAIFSSAYLLIVLGGLTTTSSIIRYLVNAEKKMIGRLKASDAMWQSFFEGLED